MSKQKSLPLQPPETSLDKVKSWFKYSETIFLSRISAAIGFVIAAVGSMDFSPLWSLFQTGTDFTQKQLIFIGVAIVGAGITFELARRRSSSLEPLSKNK